MRARHRHITLIKMRADVIDVAIGAHVSWLARMHNAAAGIDRDGLNPEQFIDDHACAFGSWLYAGKSLFPDPASYDNICLLHRHFHKDAAATATLTNRLADNAKIARTLELLDVCSAQLVDSLQSLRDSA